MLIQAHTCACTVCMYMYVTFFYYHKGVVAGVKRTRDSEERDASPKDDKKKPDPRNVPDPEELKDWNDEKVKVICENLFVVADTSTTVTLDPCNSDLDFIIQPDGLGGSPLTDGGLAYLLSGTKATWGVKKGKYFYECKVKLHIHVHVCICIVYVIHDVYFIVYCSVFLRI